MFKTLVTLVRGRVVAIGEEVADQNALAILDAATGPIAVAEKLSAEGFGSRLKPNAADVLAQLRQRAAGGEPAPGI